MFLMLAFNIRAQNAAIDWWSMFHHDLTHSGYSKSSAPNVNNTAWTFATLGNIYSSPAVADGKLYIGSIDRNVYALDAASGQLVWNYTTQDLVRSSPAVADGKLYIGSRDHNIYALNAANGELIWNYTTDNFVYSSPTVADGKVYVGSWDGKVYAFGQLNPSPSPSPTPSSELEPTPIPTANPTPTPTHSPVASPKSTTPSPTVSSSPEASPTPPTQSPTPPSKETPVFLYVVVVSCVLFVTFAVAFFLMKRKHKHRTQEKSVEV